MDSTNPLQYIVVEVFWNRRCAVDLQTQAAGAAAAVTAVTGSLLSFWPGGRWC